MVAFSKLFILYSFSNVNKRNKTINKCKVNYRIPHSQYRQGYLKNHLIGYGNLATQLKLHHHQQHTHTLTCYASYISSAYPLW